MLDLANTWRKRQQFEGTDHPGFRLQNLTTAQRDALTGAGAAKSGDAIFNATTGTLQVYTGSIWQDVNPVEAPGTVTTAATTAVTEAGSGGDHVTKLTFTNFVVHATEPDNADLAIGAKFYTLPAGAFLIESASLVGTVTKAGEATIADGEIGIGTLIGSTAVDTLGEVDAAAENVLGPIAVSNGEFDGAEVFAGVSSPDLYVAASGGVARDLFLNIAATWPDVTPSGSIRFNGTITLKWRKIN